VTPGSQVVLRSSASPDALRSFGEDLLTLAHDLSAPPDPGDTTH
jgi:hypothetical protein